ncbi:hypothetical protein BH23ACT11_BH23ACT11_14690 [soil metagenome]
MKELDFRDLPHPPLFKLVTESGNDGYAHTNVGGDPAVVGALFPSRELASEFSENASEFGLDGMEELRPEMVLDWVSIEQYAVAGADYILVVTDEGTGLFHADDLARHAIDDKDLPLFPLYMFADDRGEAPLISVDDEDGELLVAALFTSPSKANDFREHAAHLGLPEQLGYIEDADGLSRHAQIARRAGARYAVIDPESGTTEAIPIGEFIL